MSLRRIEFSNNEQITAQKKQVDDTFLWLAYAQDDDGICFLNKVSGFSPEQTFFTLEREVEKIVKIDSDADFIYIAYQDDTLQGEIISVNNPLTNTTEIDTISGQDEYPIDVKVNGSDLWFLLPGIISGSNAQLLRYDIDGNYIETIDLGESGKIVTDAVSMTIDSQDDIYIVTNTSPATTVRVFELSGGSFDYEITTYS